MVIGEVGTLTAVVWQAAYPKRLVLRMKFNDVAFIGCLILDPAFCCQIRHVLQNQVGRPIKQLGELDLMYR